MLKRALASLSPSTIHYDERTKTVSELMIKIVHQSGKIYDMVIASPMARKFFDMP
jgi:hypothetical protein